MKDRNVGKSNKVKRYFFDYGHRPITSGGSPSSEGSKAKKPIVKGFQVQLALWVTTHRVQRSRWRRFAASPRVRLGFRGGRFFYPDRHAGRESLQRLRVALFGTKPLLDKR